MTDSVRLSLLNSSLTLSFIQGDPHEQKTQTRRLPARRWPAHRRLAPPDALAAGALDFEHYKRLAQTAERGLFDAFFLADGLAANFGGNTGTGVSEKAVGFEPVTLFAALSVVTKHLGFIATASTTYEEPYTLARKFASLDHLSKGRAG